MPLIYDQIAGKNPERLAALSDGIFAVAMTLLVLDLHIPEVASIHSERDLSRALLALAPRLAVYTLSFLTLGIFWVGQQTQLNHLARSSRSLTWVHLLFLFAVTMMPFSTALLGRYIQFRLALLIYWFNVLMLGVILYWSWVCAMGSKLVKDDMAPGVPAAIRRRIVFGQAMYAIGALLCIVSTYLSLVWIVSVQLFYALGLRLPRRKTA
jgi:TMEM175 potassium channel family protein